ncbi:hypothetical protein CA223_05395 [Sphingomonas koreensis]|uniref:Uncharacterized protein n=1 Tax=Sphingomonas koreensis TaxID=93064 RepID=A0AAJ4S037_9SPHN|nr:hypothetical protein [Sphingomonas koreensis]MDC7809957.1 hypothetical protein [Sphingomonas koreensis]RSU24529.1 hypothetical protein CA224_02085 [Sphingomonas koreensis]RSU25174.1 hypothetical protein CA222_13680 [Sphingomonas koreensis]RSU30151.1 hypothetical protein CA225_05670 [Sphingomonas koreensis]RSU37412.1 hypothetical protein BRX39_05855 [Sphingomonas koreensis]
MTRHKLASAALRRLAKIDAAIDATTQPAGERPDYARAEAERVEHLVLGRDRPPAQSLGRGRAKRKIKVDLTPEVERVVAQREAYGHRAGTPETHERAAATRQGALARLHKSGAIDAMQLASAEQIAVIAERIGAGLSLRTMSMETRVDRTPMFDTRIRESLGAVRAEMAYSRWRGALGVFCAPVLEMIVEDRGVTIVAKRYGFHVRRGRTMLIDALDMWGRMFAEACRMVDDRDLAIAHARLN